MYDRDVDYPKAIASYDDEGVDAAIEWCLEQMEDGDTITVWTALKSSLRNCSELEQLVNRYSNVDHVTSRGGAFVRGTGPVLMAWPDMNDIGELTRTGGHRIRALCVINWDADELRPWVTAVNATVLGDGSDWEEVTPDLEPIVVEAMTSMTTLMNHNNTIAGGYEKDTVVSALLALHDARIPMDGRAMQGWALAHGWTGKNPERLSKYVTDINSGKRPRCRRVLRADYIDQLRRETAGHSE